MRGHRGGMVTQRIANPCIPVRFWAMPPKFCYVVYCLFKSLKNGYNPKKVPTKNFNLNSVSKKIITQ